VCGLYWFVAAHNFIPAAEAWEVRAVAFGFLLFGALWCANVVAALLQLFPPAPWLVHCVQLRREQAHARSYISHMTAKEREIIGYLLAQNQKVFIAAHDGGYAMPLISQKIVVVALQGGQVFDAEHTPMVIPDHIWRVLIAHKDQFPEPSEPDDFAPRPWRIPWVERI